MAKRGRKPAATKSTKARPRTRSQIKPSEENRTVENKALKKSKKKPASKKSDISPVSKNKVEKAKNVAKKTGKNAVQTAKPSIQGPTAKRGRKPKAKTLEKDKVEKLISEVEDDEETDVEDAGKEPISDFSKKQVDEISSTFEPAPISDPITVTSSFANPSTYQSFEAHQDPIVSKPFNVSTQESYISSFYKNSLTSSSTSAFSVPAQPKFSSNEPNISNILMPTMPLSSVNISHQSILPPNHQTLLSPPQNQNLQDHAHDLPPELLQQGWRKFWSRRENRFYYFNKVTNHSIWDMPKSSQYDPTTDPLGIQASQSANFQPPTPTDPGTPPIFPVFNLNLPPLNSKPVDLLNTEKKYIGPFDFEIDSNCTIWEGMVFYYFHPHPDAETLRCTFVNKLRQQFYELCHARQGIEPPKDSFTRWIIERKVIDKGCDPFLPSDCIFEMSKSLYNEIMNDIPIKMTKPKFSGEARKQLSKYAEAAKKIIDSAHVSAVSRKIVKWNVEDAFDWIRKTLNATYEDYIERTEHLKKQCQPHIIEAAKSSVESICLKVYHVSVDYSKRVRETNGEIFKKEELREKTPIRFMNQKKVICYPAYLINPCPKLPTVQMFTERDSTLLRYKNGEFLRLNTNFIQKLEILYFYNCRDDRKYNYFPTRVWCLLKRYQTFYNKNEGLFSQNALPLSVFSTLNKHFGVTFECFASPLNCYFRQYCSLFPDTDGYFGSRGSVLNFYPVSGSFQANPPDCEELIDACITHFEKLLESSIEPLSFIVFIQEVPETTQKVIPRLESNKFKRNHLTITSFEHEYRHGFQYVCNKSEVNVKAQYNTIIYFLQNDSGFLKWGPTPDRVEELIESFKIGRDKELPILSPPPTPLNNQKPETEVRPNGDQITC